LHPHNLCISPAFLPLSSRSQVDNSVRAQPWVDIDQFSVRQALRGPWPGVDSFSTGCSTASVYVSGC
ncbi:hypothetical protein, partial [Bowmanella yangjiangensis]